jgi:hypothetical protein
VENDQFFDETIPIGIGRKIGSIVAPTFVGVTNFSTKYHRKRGGFSPEARIKQPLNEEDKIKYTVSRTT